MSDKTMSAAETVAALRRTCHDCNPTPCCEYETLGDAAADLIEAKEAELARVTAERDALKRYVDGEVLAMVTEIDGVPLAHLRELVGAEREGRFPLCAAGTVVQTISGPVKIIGVNMRINGSWYYAYRDKSGSVRGYKSDDFGKNVFLTRAEAEAALGGGGDG